MTPHKNDPVPYQTAACNTENHDRCTSPLCTCWHHKELDEEVGYDHGGVSER